MYSITYSSIPYSVVMNEMRKQVREDHERWRKSVLCFVDRSDPGHGGLCGNMNRGTSWKGGYDGEAKKRAGNKIILYGVQMTRIKSETRKIERTCVVPSGPSKKRIIEANALYAKGGMCGCSGNPRWSLWSL